ncbi:STAS domain-containing protein [Sediminitomix flava]|uniref:Anti-sigma factor antagonist n=1 Tax=Sediminitomix flava TaxID=379075 RepID=A0A315YWD2_SEDFL|nr:STAS domain-containing protein [Sediminitomix flava]PWJ34159.1 anti-sigma B factor antagonist [Sediminitomix flava]
MSKVEVIQCDEGEFHVIKINGEVDAASSLEIDEVLEQVSKLFRNILVDCTGLTYISSAGIGVFTSRIDEWEEKGTSLVFFGMASNVETVFRILGLDQLLSIVTTIDEAKDLINGLQENS